MASDVSGKTKSRIIQWKPSQADWKRAETDPVFKHACMLNQYCDVNSQMTEILRCVINVCDDDEVQEHILGKVLDAVDSEYKQFHGITPAPKGCENWAKLKSSRLLYGTVKRGLAFEKRAERHVRSIIKFISQIEEARSRLPRQAPKTT